MCYTLLLSTDSPLDLSTHNDILIAFSRELPEFGDERFLGYPFKWFVGSRTGCSCGFRHLSVESIELGFDEPVDWYPEEREDIEATIRFIAIVRELVAAGASVDCVNTWAHGDELQLTGTVQVDLRDMRNQAFRFYENHRFLFS